MLLFSGLSLQAKTFTTTVPTCDEDLINEFKQDLI
jgi:hypothetical protein